MNISRHSFLRALWVRSNLTIKEYINLKLSSASLLLFLFRGLSDSKEFMFLTVLVKHAKILWDRKHFKIWVYLFPLMDTSFITVLGIILVIGFTAIFLLFKLVEKLSEKGMIKNFLIWNIAVIVVLCVFTIFQAKTYDLIGYGLLFSVLGISSVILCYASILLGGFGLEKKQYLAILPSVLSFVRLVIAG